MKCGGTSKQGDKVIHSFDSVANSSGMVSGDGLARNKDVLLSLFCISAS